MLEEIKNIKSEKKHLRMFGITIGLIMIIIAGYLYLKGSETFQLFFVVGVLLCVFGVSKPFVLKQIYWIWMIFATIVGWIMTRVILSLLFYMIFTSIGLILRLFGKQFIELSWNKSKDSYWNYCLDKPERDNYKKQF